MSLSTRRSSRRGGEAKTQRELVEETAACEDINHGESGKIYCVQYGARRKERYPGFFFCHECDLAEIFFCNPRTLGRWPPNWSSSKYKCKASHTNPLHPTDTGTKWSQLPVKISHSFVKKKKKNKILWLIILLIHKMFLYQVLQTPRFCSYGYLHGMD